MTNLMGQIQEAKTVTINDEEGNYNNVQGILVGSEVEMGITLYKVFVPSVNAVTYLVDEDFTINGQATQDQINQFNSWQEDKLVEQALCETEGNNCDNNRDTTSQLNDAHLFS